MQLQYDSSYVSHELRCLNEDELREIRKSCEGFPDPGLFITNSNTAMSLTEEQAVHYMETWPSLKIKKDPLFIERMKAAFLGSHIMRRYQFNYLMHNAPERLYYSSAELERERNERMRQWVREQNRATLAKQSSASTGAPCQAAVSSQSSKPSEQDTDPNCSERQSENQSE